MAAALAALTDEQRDAIALRFFAGLSAREAAEVMGKQEGTVRGLQFRAIAALAAAARDRRAGRPSTATAVRPRRDGPADGRRMIDLMAGDAELRRRLEAYAEARLSPDLAATTRMRARVLAVAHRQAALARADAAADRRADRPCPADRPTVRATRPRRSARSRIAPLTALLAACLGLAVVAGTALAARPVGRSTAPGSGSRP